MRTSVQLDNLERSIVVMVGIIVVCMCLGPCELSMTYFFLRALHLRKREESLGYASGPYAEGSIFVVDARTGLILRRPNDPPLKTRAEVKDARAQASERFDVRTALGEAASENTSRASSSVDDA